MPTLNVTAKGQITLRKDLLQHLGVSPGDKVEVSLDPRGRVSLRPSRRKGRLEDLSGMLAGQSKRVLTIDEINDYAARGWAGEFADHS